MSTENNINIVYDNSIKILSDLISFKTISGQDNNELINYCDEILKKLGATSFKTFDDEKKRANLFATLKTKNQMENCLLYCPVIPMWFLFPKVGALIHLKR